MSWSTQQELALKDVRSWFRQPDSPQIFRLFGYAGTGKTTPSREIEAIAREDGDDREAELSWEEICDFQQFTFGYALTVHKSQGSQWDDVVLFDESVVFRNDRAHHLYTGITRAAKTLTVVQ
jgi:ATP-dependent exoDNAse (exonuclease V) alpha subunit